MSSEYLAKALGANVICPVADDRRHHQIEVPAHLQHDSFAIVPLGEAGFAIHRREDSESETNSSDEVAGLENCQPHIVGILINCACVPGLYNVVAGIFRQTRRGHKNCRFFLFPNTTALRQGRYEELTIHFVDAVSITLVRDMTLSTSTWVASPAPSPKCSTAISRSIPYVVVCKSTISSSWVRSLWLSHSQRNA